MGFEGLIQAKYLATWQDRLGSLSLFRYNWDLRYRHWEDISVLGMYTGTVLVVSCFRKVP